MVRRDLVLVGALAAAVAGGAIGGVLLVGRGGRAGRLADATRAAAASGTATREAEPTAPPAPEQGSDGDERDPFRRCYRFGPLDPGSYTLIVPKGAGFEHAGEFAVEVVSQEVTRIELVVDGKDLDVKDRDGGNRSLDDGDR